MMLKRYTRLCIPDLSGRNLESSTKHVRGKKTKSQNDYFKVRLVVIRFVDAVKTNAESVGWLCIGN